MQRICLSLLLCCLMAMPCFAQKLSPVAQKKIDDLRKDLSANELRWLDSLINNGRPSSFSTPKDGWMGYFSQPFVVDDKHDDRLEVAFVSGGNVARGSGFSPAGGFEKYKRTGQTATIICRSPQQARKNRTYSFYRMPAVVSVKDDAVTIEFLDSPAMKKAVAIVEAELF